MRHAARKIAVARDRVSMSNVNLEGNPVAISVLSFATELHFHVITKFSRSTLTLA